MKKLISILSIIAILIFSSTALADDDVKVYLNDYEITFDQQPIIQDGRTLVPMRAIFENLGAVVEWEGASKTIKATRDSDVIIIVVGSNSAYVNGETKDLDVPATIINDRTLVPLRFVSEALDCLVDWNGETRTVYITTVDNQEYEPLFFDEFTGVPAPNVSFTEKQYMQPEMAGYYTCIYDYSAKELTSENLEAYMEILPQYEFYFDQDYAEETGSILYSYNNDQGLITISGDDTRIRLIVAVQMQSGDVSYYPEYKDVPDFSSIIPEYRFIKKEISGSVVSYQYSYKNQSMDSALKYVDFLRSLGYVDANNDGGGLNLTNKNVIVTLYADEVTKILYVNIDQLVAVSTNNDPTQSKNTSNSDKGYPEEGQSPFDYYLSTEYLPNHSDEYNIENQDRAVYESELSAINAKYDAMIDALRSSYQGSISGGYGSSQAMTILSQQIQKYEQQREIEIDELNAQYGY